MTYRALMFVPVVLFTTPTLFAQNRINHPDDANGDGRISRSEWRGTSSEFRQLDANRDGVLSGTEIPGNRSDDRGTIQDRPTGRTTGAAEVRKLDKNASGVVEGYEWPYNREVFHNLDTDANSVLSADEFRNISSATLKQLDRNGNGRLEPDEWPGGYAELSDLDADRDGRVSSKEYIERGSEWQRRRRFNNWDTNRNGMIDAAEWQSAPQLFRRLDANRDSQVTWEEFRADTEQYRPPYSWR
jgi:hypothetical protein